MRLNLREQSCAGSFYGAFLLLLIFGKDVPRAEENRLCSEMINKIETDYSDLKQD
jgi:hypothetical protein